MHTFVEMWQTGVTYFCVSALLATLLALAAGLLWRHCQSEIEGITAALRRMPLPVRVVAIIAIGNVIVYGSTKGPMGGGSGGSSDADYGSETMTGEDYGSETMSGEDYGSELMMLSAFSLEDADESVDTGFTAADLARGFVVTGIGTNEVWDFAMPTGATAIAQWRLRGACEDVAAIASNVVVISDGRIVVGQRLFAPLHTTLGIVPEANWGLLPSNATESLVWHGPTGGSTYGVCWRNVLPGRTADKVMSFAAEFGRDGAIVYKYGDLPDDVATNAVIGCWCAGDANWGQSTEVVYQFCRESAFANVILPSHGKYIGASSKPMSEYHKVAGDRVGCNWRMPNIAGKRTIRHVVFDTNYWKSFVASRILTPQGDRGSLTLWGRSSEQHMLFAEHLTAEYRVKTEGRGRRVEEWKMRPEAKDNHWLDGVVGCAVAASMCGCVLAGTGASQTPRATRPRVKLSELRKSRA